MMAKHLPIHPGKILSVEFLKELGVTSYALAKAVGVPTNRITGIVNGDRAISADTALRLAQYFGNSPQFWMNLQMHYDLEVAKRRVGRQIEKVVRPMSEAAGGRAEIPATSGE
jgi:addiction module HigA family antidote